MEKHWIRLNKYDPLVFLRSADFLCNLGGTKIREMYAEKGKCCQ